jgi:hypothetical protein
MAVKCPPVGESEVIGFDENCNCQMDCMDVQRVKRGRPFQIAKIAEFMHLLKHKREK